MSIDEMITKLREFGDLSFEATTAEEIKEAAEACKELITQYPAIAPYDTYLRLLSRSGGVYAHNKDIDLGLYGFSGYSVASFDEKDALDDQGYFVFGEMLRNQDGQELFLAFDTKPGTDEVYIATADSEFSPYAKSFDQFLTKLAAKDYPII